MFFKNLFQSSKFFLCPYCLYRVYYSTLADVDDKSCPNCKLPITIQYVENFDVAYPLFVQIIGWSQVGKSTYLQALTIRLREIGSTWHGFAYQPLTKLAENHVNSVLDNQRLRTFPLATVPEVRDNERDTAYLHNAYILHLMNMQRWNDRLLVIRDVAGELFDKFKYDDRIGPYIFQVRALMFMIDLTDLAKDPKRVPERLLNNFILTVEEKHRQNKSTSVAGRSLIVVFSKADNPSESLPAEIENYLDEDPFCSDDKIEIDATSYVEKMKTISDILEKWYYYHPVYKGHNFINLAKAKGMEIRFSAISSIGRGGYVEKDKMKLLDYPLEPRRALDPFFWALELQSRDQ